MHELFCALHSFVLDLVPNLVGLIKDWKSKTGLCCALRLFMSSIAISEAFCCSAGLMNMVSPSPANISLLKLSHVDNVNIKHPGVLPAADIPQNIWVVVRLTSACLLTSQVIYLSSGKSGIL